MTSSTRKPPAERPGTPISNRNFLPPTGFKFGLKRSPGVAFFCNQANIPALDLGVAEQPSYLKNIPIPGDKMEFGDLNLRFLVDEDLKNYMEIQNWIRGLGYPESTEQFDKLDKDGASIIPRRYKQMGDQIYSDATLQILSSNMVAKFNVNFKELWPYTLTTLNFDATDTDIEYFTADVTFKYTLYELTTVTNEAL